MFQAINPVNIVQCVAFTLCKVAVGWWMERWIVPACNSMGIRSLCLKRALACDEISSVRPTQRKHRLQDMNVMDPLLDPWRKHAWIQRSTMEISIHASMDPWRYHAFIQDWSINGSINGSMVVKTCKAPRSIHRCIYDESIDRFTKDPWLDPWRLPYMDPRWILDKSIDESTTDAISNLGDSDLFQSGKRHLSE